MVQCQLLRKVFLCHNRLVHHSQHLSVIRTRYHFRLVKVLVKLHLKAPVNPFQRVHLKVPLSPPRQVHP